MPAAQPACQDFFHSGQEQRGGKRGQVLGELPGRVRFPGRAAVTKASCVAGVAILAFAASPTVPLFEDRSAKSRIDFVLDNSRTPEKHLIETMAGGVAVLD